jgi:hypothetical protein
VSTLATQSRIASLIASLRVRDPVLTACYLSAHQSHPGDVECLSLGVNFSHVDNAAHAHQGGCRRCRHTVLTSARLRDEAILAQPLRQQCLPENVVDFVTARVVEVFAFQKDSCPTAVLCEAVASVMIDGRPV